MVLWLRFLRFLCSHGTFFSGRRSERSSLPSSNTLASVGVVGVSLGIRADDIMSSRSCDTSRHAMIVSSVRPSVCMSVSPSIDSQHGVVVVVVVARALAHWLPKVRPTRGETLGIRYRRRSLEGKPRHSIRKQLADVSTECEKVFPSK